MRALKLKIQAWGVGALCLWLAGPTVGQDKAKHQIANMLRRELSLEQETRAMLEPGKVLKQGALFDYGGFVRTNLGRYDSFDDDNKVNRTFKSADFRLWASLTLDEVHQFYLRLEYEVIDFNDGSEYDDLDTHIGPNVDQAFYSVQLDKMASKYWNQQWPLRLKMTVGRQYLYIGNGMVYSQVDDGILFEGQAGNWDFKALGARTIGRQDDIDTSEGSLANERYFVGGEVAYAGFPHFRPYAYALLQEDKRNKRYPYTRANGDNGVQRCDYDSYYLGLGATGEIVRNLGYRIEGVLERGDSTGDYSQVDLHEIHSTDNIRAYAFNTGLDYYFDHKTKPRVSIDYFFASGDKDRAQPINTEDGNRPGTPDHSFIGFGYVDAGFNLAPAFSNIQFIRLDSSFHPMPDYARFKDLELGMSYFFFQKHEAQGGISDDEADKGHRDVGNEIDAYMNWRIFHDLSLSLRYGLFMPGATYSDHSRRHFMLATLTYSF